MKHLKEPWLIQRLLKALDSPTTDIFNPPTDRFTDKAKELLYRIFRTDYMGSAEFEFGALPAAFQRIWDNRENYVFVKKQIPNTKFFCYMIVPNDAVDDLPEYLDRLWNNRFRLKEWSGFNESYTKWKKEKFWSTYIGWLDLDNDIIYFKLFNAAKKFAILLGIYGLVS